MEPIYDIIKNNFRYHEPKDNQPERYKEIRERCRTLALFIVDTVPDCRERAIAITKLEEAMMWANAGIARNE